MNSSEFEATKHAILDRLIKSAERKNVSELEIAAAIYGVWEGFIDEQVNSFFERVDKHLRQRDPELEFADELASKKACSSVGWKRKSWQESIWVTFEFELSNYRKGGAGIQALVATANNADQHSPISESLHLQLEQAARKAELTCIKNIDRHEWWPLSGYVAEMDDCYSPQSLLWLNGDYEGVNLEDLLVNDIVQLISVVDLVLDTKPRIAATTTMA